ncbi:A-macroglobulin complement component [Stieleria neptunia]|uniref:A-macroglobulin complement component n=1 Tax=Stieleria neptunia TaxID=2527979 RepID=A0A518HI85_9BACT|nr:MG2 domain-containing protein [Stieleria neptunia]QDV40529.1 A-macroglobulin complement component [Stieleria neptunia]
MNHEPNTNHPPTDDDDLRQALLELHYGLLDDDESAELKQRIDTDPTVAQRWAETLLVASKLAAAAKVSAPAKREPNAPPAVQTPVTPPPVVPTTPREPTETEPERNKMSAAASPPDASPADVSPADVSPAAPNRFLRLWLGSLATAATLAIAISGVRYLNQRPASPDAELHVAVQPVAGADAGARNEFLVAVGPQPADPTAGETFDPSMPVVPATISFKVLSQGAVLFFGTSETTTQGPCRIRVPDDIAIPGDAVLHVDANPTGRKGLVRLTVPLEPTRCLTFLSTDRPVYRPGETVFFRSVTLNRRTLAAHLDVPIRFELADASGAAVDGAILEGVTERGVGNGTFVIPETAPGGTYQLIAKSLDGFFPDQICELEVRRYRAVRLKTDLEFSKRSYSASDRVEATLTVRRADDSIPVAAPARIQAVVDGSVVHQSTSSLGINGELAVDFDLPKVIREGEGTLSIAIDDGSVTETAARPIPIHTGRAEVDFYPEGGYLVGGVNNRVYFAARDPDGNPIEIAGEVLSQAGRMVASIKTVRDGMGRFEFKPESGQRYSLRITSPLDITETPWLPSVVEALPVLDTGGGVFEPGDPISMTVRSTKRRSCIVRVVCRGELVGVKTTELGIGDTSVSVPIQDRAAGVIRVTVLDAAGETATPLVERLVYRKAVKKLNVTASVDEDRRVHSPGESVRMTIAVTDENDQPVPGAVLGVRVVDDAALSLRQQDLPSIATHFFLTSEIQSPEDLEHADFYLDDSPEAAESLDLLLGTQGWRRFVSGSPDQFNETFRDALTRLLELDGQRTELTGRTQTNEATIAAQLHQYRLHLAAAWRSFVSEVRIALILIGAFWLIGLLVRPRKAGAVAAGLLLFAAVMLAQSGCGSQGNYRVEATSESASDQMTAGDIAPMLEAPSASSSADEARFRGEEEQADAAGADPGATQPFVQRVVQAFLGQRGAKVPTEVSQSRLTPEQLQRWAKSRDLDAQTLADQLMDELRFPIRQYAHLHRRSEDDVRSDFTETLYWNPMMVTDSTGTATIRFDLSDSLTMFRVDVDAHSTDGRLGSGGGSVVTEIPIQVEPKLPLEVTGGDRIDLPVGLVNATDQDGAFEVQLQLDPAFNATRRSGMTSVAAGERSTEVFSLDVTEPAKPTDAKVRVSATLSGSTLADQVERTVRIVPDGFPFDVSQSGSLSKTTSLSANLPETVVPGSLSAEMEFFPSPRSQLSAGLESILREPHGCFEQASASNYPNVMAFQLLQLEGVVDDRAQRRTVSLLRRGYRKLTSYECSTLGYEWFGNDPGHEALSAFGLMQFSEMAKMIDIDREMLSRTREWLLSRRDGKGGFKRNPRHLHVWSVQQEVVNAYLLWALSQADLAADDASRTDSELSAELDAMQHVAESSDDPYLIALSAITLANVGRNSQAAALLERLAELQQPDGSFVGKTTITQSGGISRTVETTALAILAFACSDDHRGVAQKAAAWLIDHRRGGGFGSTQATVLALKALIAMHDQMVGGEGGSVDILIDGEVVETVRWEGRPAEGVTWQMTPTLIDAFVSDPTTRLTLRSSDAASLPFTLRFSGRTTTPSSDPECPIAMNLSFAGQPDQANVESGETIDVVANVTNATNTGRPMTVAVVGLPGGLEPIIESLEKLRQSGEIDFYELRGREVVLYWRTFAPAESKRIPIACVAEIAGKYTGPPSRAYLYYTAESKTWHKPLVAEIR